MTAAPRCSAGSLTGKVALIRRGTCRFYDEVVQCAECRRSGRRALQQCRRAAQPDRRRSAADHHSGGGGHGAGRRADRRHASPPADDADLDRSAVSIADTPTGGLISGFSSYGLAPDLTLKPDIGAPGGSIFSTYPARAGRLRQHQRHLDGLAARGRRRRRCCWRRTRTSSPGRCSRLQNTADPRPGPAIRAWASSTTSIGRAPACSTSTTRSSRPSRRRPASCRSARAQAGPQTRTLTIRNRGARR